MKKLLVAVLAVITLGIAAPTPASALSCLEMSEYLTMVAADEEILVFTATTKDTLEETDYTAEVLTVTNATRGYIENTVMVYHEKHSDWGYLCNAGPAKKGASSLYIVNRNEIGQYEVANRLELSSNYAKTLISAIEKTDTEGQVVAQTTTDRRNQIMTTIMDLFKQISVLLKEYNYWSSVK